MNLYLVVGLVIAVIIIIYLIAVLIRIKLRLNTIREALEDIRKGNLNRRILTRNGDITSQICYEINEIISESQLRFIQQKQAEKAYKQLMTNLSHDVKTPLASMIGYIEAIEMKMVEGEEKEQFFHVVYEKAEHLKEFVESLFEWVKIDSGEQRYQFQVIDINELSREIAAEWALILEQRNFSYEFTIPEEECFILVDRNAYTRILNNLLQNSIAHSEGTKVRLMMSKTADFVKIMVWDNGD